MMLMGLRGSFEIPGTPQPETHCHSHMLSNFSITGRAAAWRALIQRAAVRWSQPAPAVAAFTGSGATRL